LTEEYCCSWKWSKTNIHKQEWA